MGRITDEDIARVRDATDLVALVAERVPLKQKGRLFWGNCPFHGEKTPSFKIDPATQLWHCFGCGAGGDSFGFVMRSDNVDFPDAVRMLADRGRIEIVEEGGGVPRGHKERVFAAMAAAVDYYHRVLTGSRDAGATSARDYLAGRGLGSDVAKRWTLGFAPGRGALTAALTKEGFSPAELVDANLSLKGDDGRLKDRFYNRVMFPIFDLQGRAIAFGGRVMGAGEPKYLNTNDTPVFHKSASMYAIDKAKGPITAQGTAIVVEGYTDVIALHEAGMTNVVATLGTALTRQHLKLLGRFARRVVYLFDGDEAGMRAADRAVEFVDRTATAEAGAAQVTLDVAMIPDGLDPADYVGANGVEAMRALVDDAVPLLRFAIERRLDRWDLERPEERARALHDAAAVLTPVRGSTLASDYAMFIADRLSAAGMPVQLQQVLSAIPATARATHVESEEDVPQVVTVTLGPPASPRARAERELLSLMVTSIPLRGRARELLAEALVSEPAHVTMATIIAEAPQGESPAALAGRLESAVPGAGEAISAFTGNSDDEHENEQMANDLTLRVKEFELERRISMGRARLNSPDIIKDPELSDEIVREVSTLQRELDALRRSNG